MTYDYVLWEVGIISLVLGQSLSSLAISHIIDIKLVHGDDATGNR